MLTSGGGGGGSSKGVQDGDGLINPAMVPCEGLEPEKITEAATTIKNEGGGVRTNASSVSTTWSGLAPHYVAPESGTVLALMNPVASEADLLATKMETVSTILTDFASDVVPIKDALEVLKTEAQDFVDSVRNGIYVQPSDPDHPQFSTWASQQGYYGSGSAGTSYSGSWNGYGATQTEQPALTGTTIYWKDHGPSVARNEELVFAVADEYAKLDAAQVDAANRILALVENSCVVPLEAVEAWQLKQDGVELPWGSAVEKNRDCGESFVHGMGEAVVSFGEGIGSLFGYNPLTGEWGDGEWAGQAWSGLGMTLAGLALAGPVSISVMLAPPGAIPAPVRDFVIGSQEALVNAGKGIIAYDTWSENPAEAAGTTLVNVGTFFIPGAGQVGGILKTTAAGARVASVAGFAGRVVDVAVPGGSFVVKGFSEGVLGNALRFGRGVDDAISFDVRVTPNPVGGLGQLPDGSGPWSGSPLPDGSRPVDLTPGSSGPGDLPAGPPRGSDFGNGFHAGDGAPVPHTATPDAAPTATPDGTAAAPHGTTTAPDGTTTAPDGTTTAPDGTTTAPDGTAAAPHAPSGPAPAHLNATHPDGGAMSFDEWNATHGDPAANLSQNKGQFGEIRAEEYMRSQGFERIDDGADGSKNPNAPGVDGIYRREGADGQTEYVVGEAKYGSSDLGSTLDGRQMSQSWLNGDVTGIDRLGNAMRQADGSTYDAFMDAQARGDVDSALLKIDSAGDVTVRALDGDGYVIKDAAPFAPAAAHLDAGSASPVVHADAGASSHPAAPAHAPASGSSADGTDGTGGADGAGVRPDAAGSDGAPAGAADDGGGAPGDRGAGTPGHPGNSDAVISQAARADGVSLTELHDLRNTPVTDLSASQIDALRAYRDLIPDVDGGTAMVKVLPHADAASYLSNTYDSVGGFVARAGDVDTGAPLARVVEDLRLDYVPDTGSVNPYTAPGADSFAYIEFAPSRPDLVETAYGPVFGGVTDKAAPFTGNGFTGTPRLGFIPEYVVSNGERMSLTTGDRIFENVDGRTRLLGVFEDGVGFVTVGARP